MIITTEAAKSKLKKHFHHGVRMGFFSATIWTLPLMKGIYCAQSFKKHLGFPGGANGKEADCQCGKQRRRRRLEFSLWVGKIPWRRKWQPPPAFLPWKSHGQRSLVGHSPWGHKELDTAEAVQPVSRGCHFPRPPSRGYAH